jgi:hypothetical protein
VVQRQHARLKDIQTSLLSQRTIEDSSLLVADANDDESAAPGVIEQRLLPPCIETRSGQF